MGSGFARRAHDKGKAGGETGEPAAAYTRNNRARHFALHRLIIDRCLRFCVVQVFADDSLHGMILCIKQLQVAEAGE